MAISANRFFGPISAAIDTAVNDVRNRRIRQENLEQQRQEIERQERNRRRTGNLNLAMGLFDKVEPESRQGLLKNITDVLRDPDLDLETGGLQFKQDPRLATGAFEQEQLGIPEGTQLPLRQATEVFGQATQRQKAKKQSAFDQSIVDRRKALTKETEARIKDMERKKVTGELESAIDDTRLIMRDLRTMQQSDEFLEMDPKEQQKVRDNLVKLEGRMQDLLKKQDAKVGREVKKFEKKSGTRSRLDTLRLMLDKGMLQPQGFVEQLRSSVKQKKVDPVDAVNMLKQMGLIQANGG